MHRRRRKIFRRKRVFRRGGVGRGNIRFKFTKVITVRIARDNQTVYPMSVSPNEFPEFLNLAPNFEAYKLSKLRVRIRPKFNIGAMNATTMFPGYVMLPWHSESPNSASNDITTYMSVDKAKYYRGYQSGQQTYNLASLTAATYAGTDNPVVNTSLRWSPRLEITRDTNSTKVIHYGGLVVWEGMLNKDETPILFEVDIIQDVWGIFYNQKTLL